MTTARCYRREPLSIQKALEKIANCAGTQFDPKICNYFIEFIGRRQGYLEWGMANA